MHSIPIYIYRYFSHRSSAATAPTNLWKPMISIYAKAPVITENKQSHLLISFIFLNSQDVSLMFLCVLKRAVSHGPTVFCLLQDAPRCPKAGIGSLINSLGSLINSLNQQSSTFTNSPCRMLLSKTIPRARRPLREWKCDRERSKKNTK